MNWKGGGEENTEMKALKDAEFDQRYILDAKHTILHTYLCIHTSPPPLNFTDICKFKMPF